MKLKTFSSSFGFKITIPESWTVFTRTNVANKGEMLLDRIAKSSGMGGAGLQQCITSIKNGDLEVYETTSDEPCDAILVSRSSPENAPKTAEELKPVCAQMQSFFSQQAGRDINVYACRLEMINAGKAVYTEFDSEEPSTRTMRYVVIGPKKFSLFKPSVPCFSFTANIADSAAESFRSVFSKCISSISF